MPNGRHILGRVATGYSSDCEDSARDHAGIERTFVLPNILDVIPSRPRSVLVGRWRCNVYFDSKSILFGGYVLGRGRFCEEYDFREDGSYSKWRVSKHDNKIMPATEEKGQWKYHDGIISIQREYGIACVGMAVRSMAIMKGSDYMLKRRNLIGENPFDWILLWHSDSEFTVKYINVDGSETDVKAGPFGGILGERGWCDSEGCFRQENIAIGDIVVTPLRFKRVSK